MKTQSNKLEEMIRKYEDNPNVILGDKVPSISELKSVKKAVLKLEDQVEYWKERCLSAEECMDNIGEPSSRQPKEYYDKKRKIAGNYERIKSQENERG